MTIPQLRAPFVYVEFDPSRAFVGPSILAYKVLLIGQRISSGARPELQLDKVTSYEEAVALYGSGSNLARMFKAWFAGNRYTEVYGISQDDDGAGVAATGSFAITGTATAVGSFVGYIDGERFPVAVTVGMTAAQIGDALVAAVGSEVAVTIANVTGTATTTSKNLGESGNGIDLRINYNAGEELPAGISCVVTAMSSGANNPDIADVITAIGDTWFNVMCAPYYDATNLTAIEAELLSRFGPLRMIDGQYISSRRGTISELATFGNGRNSQFVEIPHCTASPTSTFEFAAAWTAQIAQEAQNDPARPFQSLALTGVLPPVELERFTLEENNALLYDGISTFYVDNGGIVRIQRAITMYQTNAIGAADIAYLDANTMFTLMYLRYDFRTQILTRYPRAKLADDGVQVGPGQQVMTPLLGKSEAINIFRDWETLGLVENIDQFKQDLICQRSIADPNRLEWIIPPDLMNQFRVGAAVIQFLLES